MQLIKKHGALYPANQSDLDTLNKIKNGALIDAKLTQPRNPQFHRKFFALLEFGYEYYEIPEGLEWEGEPAEKSFKMFRYNITIKAGYYTVTADINGNIKLEAKSIKFGSMEQSEFDKLYADVFNAIYSKVLNRIPGMTEEAAHNTLNQILSFD